MFKKKNNNERSIPPPSKPREKVEGRGFLDRGLMKKFDLNKYEQNKKLPLITNTGKRVDILTTSFFKNGKTYCIGITEDDDYPYNETILIFDREGNCLDCPNLKVGFKTIEKSGWVILEDLPDGNQLVRRGYIYKTQFEALLDCKISNAKVVEIHWEE